MKITFLGTGSIIPNPKYNHKKFRSFSSILIEIRNNTLLFDIGPGTLTKMQQIGIDTRIKPSHLFITHYHIDHCQDYIGLVKGRGFDPKTGKPLKNFDLNVYGPNGLESWNSDLFKRTKKWSYMSSGLNVLDSLKLKECKKGVIEETKYFKITCLPVKHYDGIAYRIDAEGKSFVYSGDMAYDENLATLGKDADVVAIECSFPDKKSLQGLHLCPEDIAKLANLGNFKQVFLTHLYPQCEGKEKEMIQEIQKSSDVRVQVAYDFLQIQL